MSRRGDGSPIQTHPAEPGLGALELDAFFPTVYAALRKLAHRRLQSEASGHTLSTTALVNETYLKLSEQRSEFANRPHFFALAARAMRRILVDYARKHRAAKRPNPAHQVSLSLLEASQDVSLVTAQDGGDRAGLVLALDEAVEQLQGIEERLARVVEYRFFVGLTETETAELLGVTPRTVTRDWVRARAWLLTHLRDPSNGSG